MRCTSCGMPLSPNRASANCPRCGTPLQNVQKATATLTPQQFDQSGWGQPLSNPGIDTWNQPVQAPYAPFAAPATPMTSMPQATPVSFPEQQGWQPAPEITPTFPPQQTSPLKVQRSTRLGLTVASLCILTSALLLIFVYFMALGLPNTTSSNPGISNVTQTIPSPTARTSPAVTPSPTVTTATYPGQQYIDNAQMATGIDPTTLQPTQVTTTFRTGQTIYVTFNVHTGGHSGAVCASWFLNGQQTTSYGFNLGANSHVSYATALYNTPGSGYVELFWATSKACTDELLAQKVNFTVQ